jgi:outer membrane protein OmpA-like peptidoglycan-associated protein
VSYGEERPKHDNSTDAGRRLNRRAALVARIQ